MRLHVSSTVGSSSGGQNCIIQHLVSSHSVGGRSVRTCATAEQLSASQDGICSTKWLINSTCIMITRTNDVMRTQLRHKCDWQSLMNLINDESLKLLTLSALSPRALSDIKNSTCKVLKSNLLTIWCVTVQVTPPDVKFVLLQLYIKTD